MILCERPKNKVTIFLVIGDSLFAICRAANTKLFFGSAAFAVTKRYIRKK